MNNKKNRHGVSLNQKTFTKYSQEVITARNNMFSRAQLDFF